MSNSYTTVRLEKSGEFANKKEFFLGMSLMAGFIIVLLLMFYPLFNGKNTLNYLDDLFNSISKGSAYYIPSVKEEVQPLIGKQMNVKIKLSSEDLARKSQALFQKSGVQSTIEGTTLQVAGSFGTILGYVLDDADILFHNQGESLEAKYAIPGREVLYVWWETMKATEKSLNSQEQFEDAKVVHEVMARAVEPAYNYYKIEARNMSEKAGMVVFALIFYVIYTIWYGYAILFMFEGWGLKISH